MALVAVVVLGVVLRFWSLGHAHLSIDESYTALAARMPVADLVRHIDHTDPHPPLSYLLFKPFSALTTDVGWLRMASALASSGALVLLAWWQRRRGVAGVVATAVFALSAFQLSYGREMRMYGFLALGGVATAWAAERWLDDGRRRWIAVAALAATACAFSHATGIIVLLALGAIPLLRRDRRAWEMRLAVVAGLASFAVLWGAHALSWRGATSTYPKASLSWLSIVVNETVAPVPSNRWIVLPLLVLGGVLIVARRDASTKVWLLMAVAPVAALYLASFGQGVLIPKSLMAYSWGVALPLGAVVGAAWKRSVVTGVAAAALVALMLVPYVRNAVEHDEGAGGMAAGLEEVVGEGDAIAVTQSRSNIRDLVEWYEFTVPGVDIAYDDTSVPGLRLVSAAGETPSGRIWLVTSGPPDPVEGMQPCSDVRDVGGTYQIQCLTAAS